MDRRMDGGDCNIPDAFLKKRGDNYLIPALTCIYPITMIPEEFSIRHFVKLFTLRAIDRIC